MIKKVVHIKFLADIEHKPVLAEEVINQLGLKNGFKVVDATLGLGGHSALIAKEIGSKGKIYAFDQDKRNLVKAKKNLESYLDRIEFFNSNFANIYDLLSSKGEKFLDAALFDIGISSLHFDEAERGFSFNKEGYLDMRMDQNQELTAYEVINRFGEKLLADIFFQFGEERESRRIAAAIVMDRRKKPISTTTELAGLISRVKKSKKKFIHPATQVFQALRIYVNSELEVLEQGMDSAFRLLKPGGKLVIISFHSLEDRIVKNFFKNKASDCICPPEVMRCECEKEVEAKIITKKPITPSVEEIKDNPRSRSAKLRVLQKIK